MILDIGLYLVHGCIHELQLLNEKTSYSIALKSLMSQIEQSLAAVKARKMGVVLADNAPSYSLTITKEHVADLNKTLALARSLMPIDDDDIDKFMGRLKDRYPYQSVPLKFRLTEEEIAVLAINRYRLPGVEVEAEFVRSYPYGALFAHALGYVGRISEKDLKVYESNKGTGDDY